MSPDESWGRAVFDRLYAADPDPWRFDSSPYELGKYADTLSEIGAGRFRRALELGCGNGAMTARLADRCDRLVAVDISPAAIALAAARCRGLDAVSTHVATLPDDLARLPSGPYDLLVVSELLYFLSGRDIDRLVASVRSALAPGTRIVLVNWTGHTDTPCTGDQAAERFMVALASTDRFEHRHHRREGYRLDRLDRQGGDGTVG